MFWTSDYKIWSETLPQISRNIKCYHKIWNAFWSLTEANVSIKCESSKCLLRLFGVEPQQKDAPFYSHVDLLLGQNTGNKPAWDCQDKDTHSIWPT